MHYHGRTTISFKKVGEHRSERNEITSSQLTDTGELIKINTAYCDMFLGNTPRNLIWNIIDYILYKIFPFRYHLNLLNIASRFSGLAMHQTHTHCQVKFTLEHQQMFPTSKRYQFVLYLGKKCYNG